MDSSALRLHQLSGAVDPGALAGRELRVRLDHAVIAVDGAAVRRGLPADGPAALERLAGPSAVLRVRTPLGSAQAEVRLSATADGALALELVAVRTELLGLPTGLVAAAIREFLPAQPWLRAGPGARWEADPRELLAARGVDLPPLVRVAGGPDELLLEFARPAPGAGNPTDTAAAAESAEALGDAAAAGTVDSPTSSAQVSPAHPAPPAPPPPAVDPLDALREPAPEPPVIAQLLPPRVRMDRDSETVPGAVEARLDLRYEDEGLLSLRLRGRPAWVRVEPENVTLRAGQVAGVSIRADVRRLAAEPAAALALEVSWSLLETPAGAAPCTTHGKRTVEVQRPG